MATRNAKVKLKADTSGYRRQMDRAAGSTKKVSTGLKAVGRAAGGALRSVAGLATKMAAVGAAGAVVGGILAARKAYGLLAESIELVGIQLEAERHLESVLNNQRKAGVKIATDLADRLKKQASALQEVGTTGDEVTIRGQAQLATFRGLIPHIERASEVMLQLSEFTGQDAVNAANLLGKAAEGNIGALSRYGISLSETAKKTKDIGLILEEVSSQLPTLGVSASTARGRMKQLGNQIGDLKEQLGEALTPAIKAAVAAVRPVVGQMQAWVQANRAWLEQKFTDALKAVGLAVADVGSRVAAFVQSGGLELIAAQFMNIVNGARQLKAEIELLIVRGQQLADLLPGGASAGTGLINFATGGEDPRQDTRDLSIQAQRAEAEAAAARARSAASQNRTERLQVNVTTRDERLRNMWREGIERLAADIAEERERQKMADAIQAFSDVQAALPI